ncbi:GNAT family N-acetyltransferase [Actinocorallia sp. B10E7]|uniref:GNAT family N-acetyltransferase n=1 Tax=Actinocorallia sp. B10E7 TaxID=3153558 RepID=UPI00325F5BE4
MIELSENDKVRGWFHPEVPGPLIGPHVLRTGLGRILVDDPADPGTVLAEAGGDNYDLSGDPSGLDCEKLPQGFYRTDEDFAPLLAERSGDLYRWPRVIYELAAEPRPVPGVAAGLRVLEPRDTAALEALSPELQWITETWGGHEGAAASGLAVGAFAGGRLVSVALPFYLGERYEDIGVVTEDGHRGRGLSAACAARVVACVLRRGRRPSWSTSPDNQASRRVAAKLGFRFVREDQLYVTGFPPPPGS